MVSLTSAYLPSPQPDRPVRTFLAPSSPLRWPCSSTPAGEKRLRAGHILLSCCSGDPTSGGLKFIQIQKIRNIQDFPFAVSCLITGRKNCTFNAEFHWIMIHNIARLLPLLWLLIYPKYHCMGFLGGTPCKQPQADSGHSRDGSKNKLKGPNCICWVSKAQKVPFLLKWLEISSCKTCLAIWD